MHWLLRQKFFTLLLTLLLLIVIYPILQDYVPTRSVFIVLRSALFVIAFYIVLKDKRYRTGAAMVGVPAAIGIWSEYLHLQPPHVVFSAAMHVLAGLFLLFLVTVILRAVYQDDDVTPDSIFGTLCGYLLVALTFGHFFTALEVLEPGSFVVNEQTLQAFNEQKNDYYLLTYFSLVTITTVGYGDIMPGTAATRGLATVEAITGQFYIAVLVAELIGKRVSRAVSRRSQD